ncbi:hypothetical protein F5J12DRAFT_823483 [Pisolithus orientalis]|uniref:uncharacterized protein n=1 Tax=Pisolithus orientalis TaxID=936130 RepID=UPI00222591C8|nr:uncharacterized protein F5J12DRAFT_823483 [Pisolithus orientalis]KAI6009416.1 hypothetical protein F5J12DRAFT_823483 [Pisolithus orientalis]
MFTMAALPTTSTTTTMRGTTGTTTAVASHTSASSSSASSCSNCLRAIEIAAPCVISALLAAGIIFYLKSRRAKAKKEDNRVAPFTDMPSAPLPSIPAAERKARMRAAQSWVLGVHTEAHFSDRPSVRDGLLSEGSSGVGRESPTCGGGSEESDEIHINDRARSAASGVGPSAPLSDTVVALQSSPTQSHSAYGPPPSYR